MSQSIKISRGDSCNEMESHCGTCLPIASLDDSMLNVSNSRTSKTSNTHKMAQSLKDGLLGALNEFIQTKYLERGLEPVSAQCKLL